MHITEGVLTGPSFVITNVIGAALIAKGVMAMQKFSKDQPQRKPLLGMLGAVVFFVSLIHLPAFGGLTCSHPCGTPLAGILLGPWVAVGPGRLLPVAAGAFLRPWRPLHPGCQHNHPGPDGRRQRMALLQALPQGRPVLGRLRRAGRAGGRRPDLRHEHVLILDMHFSFCGSPSAKYSFAGYAKALTLAYLPVQGPLAVLEMFVTGYAVKLHR